MNFRLVPVLIAAMLGGACSGGASGPTEVRTSTATHRATGPVFPQTAWDDIAPDEAGFDAAALTAVGAGLRADRSTCFVVTRHGRLVHEEHWGPGDPISQKPLFSVTKSITSLLIGIAADDGLLTLEDKASTYLPQWRGTPSENVTIRNLLSNDSGRHWDFDTDYSKMAFGARDKTAFALGLGQDAPPGTVWAYNNSAIQALSAVLLKATGEEPRDFAAERLFGPLGMRNTSWGVDQSGHSSTFAGVSSTCLDMARIGYLALNGGRWEGRQIVSAAYVRSATSRSSQQLNAAYGLLWWVNRRGPILGALTASGSADADRPYVGRLAPDVPADAFWAIGYAKQVVAVVPSHGIVAVRLGDMPDDEEAISPNSFTAAVLDAER